MYEVTTEDICALAKEMRETIKQAINYPPVSGLTIAHLQAEIIEAWINEDDVNSLYDAYMIHRYGEGWDRNTEDEEYRDNVILTDIAAMNASLRRSA